jgi:hypothetical protein
LLAETAVNEKFGLLLTVTIALNGVGVPPDVVAVTLTVPLVTIVPDHVRLFGVVVRVTTVLLLSVNFQFATVTPDDGVTVHVAVLPLKSDEGQVSFATPPPPQLNSTSTPAPRASLNSHPAARSTTISSGLLHVKESGGGGVKFTAINSTHLYVNVLTRTR